MQVGTGTRTELESGKVTAAEIALAMERVLELATALGPKVAMVMALRLGARGAAPRDW